MNADLSPLSIKMPRTDRKVQTNHKPSIYNKKKMKVKKGSEIEEKLLKLDPLTEGRKGLQIDGDGLL